MSYAKSLGRAARELNCFYGELLNTTRHERTYLHAQHWQRIIMPNSSAMSHGMLELLAERFKALGEPARLQLLVTLREGERTVSELVQQTGLGQANASRHLQILYGQGFVTRRKTGLRVVYTLSDRVVLNLCDAMYSRVELQLDAQQRHLSG